MTDIRSFLSGKSNNKFKAAPSRKRIIVEDDESEDIKPKKTISMTNDNSTITPEEFFNSRHKMAENVPPSKQEKDVSIKEPSPIKKKLNETKSPRRKVLPKTQKQEKFNEVIMKEEKLNEIIQKDSASKAADLEIQGNRSRNDNFEDRKVEHSAEEVLKKCPLESISTLEKAPPKSFRFADRKALAPGSKQLPVGQENCLASLSFSCTGVLESLDREEVTSLIKKYGGRVVSAPSRKVSFVVLGKDSGPRKLQTIKDYNLKAINEDGLFYLIANMPMNGGNSKAAQDAMAKKKLEQENIVKDAKLLSSEQLNASSELWTVKYSPKTLKEFCGNKSAIQKISFFLSDWDQNLKGGFKNSGPEGLGTFRAVLLSGPPGIGKTTAAHLIAKNLGYDILERNASDARNKTLLSTALDGVTDNTSIVGFFDQIGKTHRKSVLIMDEIDGMSSGDRGGVAQLNQIIKKTQIPIICICNDKSDQKMRPLDKTTFDIKFIRPQASVLRARLMTIAFKEGLKLSSNAIDQLVQSTHSDIRQIINMLSSWKISRNELNDESSRKLGKDSEKNTILKPWAICAKFLSGSIFEKNTTFNASIELYFNDHEMSYLMVQENYLKTIPFEARDIKNPRLQNKKRLELSARAAESISESDLIDAAIHGSQQQWSLMPIHAVFSCIRPSFYVAGQATSQYSFTSWLGNNSKRGKATRLLKDLQSKIRLKATVDHNDTRQSYIPFFIDETIGKLAKEGSQAIDQVICLMDEYYLSREDLDSLAELGLGPRFGSKLMKEVSTATKSAFTRKYNQLNHPIPFYTITQPIRVKNSKEEAPDLEDAILTDNDDSVDDDNEDEEEVPTKDKLVTVGGKRKANTTKASQSKRKKKIS